MGSDAEIREMLQRARFDGSAEQVPIDKQVELSKRIQRRMSFGALARVLDTVPVEQLAHTRDDVLAVLRTFEGLFIKPLAHRTSIAETYPDGLVTHWLQSDPFMFGFLLLWFQSIRLDQNFQRQIDEMVEESRELLVELDDIIKELIIEMDKIEADKGAKPPPGSRPSLKA